MTLPSMSPKTSSHALRVVAWKEIRAKPSHLTVRRVVVFCARCKKVDPVHPGDGTPLPAFLVALEDCVRRHPAEGQCV